MPDKTECLCLFGITLISVGVGFYATWPLGIITAGCIITPIAIYSMFKS